jgi:hypothetical protein
LNLTAFSGSRETQVLVSMMTDLLRLNCTLNSPLAILAMLENVVTANTRKAAKSTSIPNHPTPSFERTVALKLPYNLSKDQTGTKNYIASSLQR